MQRHQFLQIEDLVDPLLLSTEPHEQNFNFKEKNVYSILIIIVTW